jgi:hypothetical protein
MCSNDKEGFPKFFGVLFARVWTITAYYMKFQFWKTKSPRRGFVGFLVFWWAVLGSGQRARD